MPLGPPYPSILLCTPIYRPDPGHEDRWKHQGPFYAVVSEVGKWRGAVTSVAALERMMQRYPDSRTFKASPWSRFDKLWTMDCKEYHNHEGEQPVIQEPMHPTTPESSAPSSPSTLTESTTSRLPSPLPSLTASPSKAGLRDENAPRNAPKLSKDDLDYLASSRPAPGPISMNQLNQQFTRVLGPQAVAPSIAPHLRDEPLPASPARQRTRTPMTAGEVQVALEREEPSRLLQTPCTDRAQSTHCRNETGQAFDQMVEGFNARWHKVVEEIVEARRRSKRGRDDSKNRAEARAAFDVMVADFVARKSEIVEEMLDARARGSTPVFYAVSGCNRVFQDRAPPGADLVFTCDEDELFEFLAEEVAGKMKI
ncbi:hypothetical protein MVEN_00125800 [Mycena venus]|uniref:Uncharacterized protein n=1 Tax=Mycena venus TaxID=2733690 RepID=A0A8H7DGT9_9AGAR|nr:hypothetical protein MVEN_00125800 [Mycena venus]